MKLTHFIYVESGDSGSLPQDAVNRLRELLASCPGLTRALFYLPATAKDYYTDDGPSPALALQLYYADIETLERNIGAGGYLQEFAHPEYWEALPGLRITHQAMLVRDFSLAGREQLVEPSASLCSYLVHYPGEAEDFNAWLNFYLDNHPQILRTFPGLREIEVYTRIDWRDSLPWERVHFMQRNRLIFDSAEALEGALNSPVRHQSRADFENFPPFTGSNIHFPMLTEELPVNG